MSGLLFFYHWGAKLHRFFHGIGLLKTHRIKKPVLSVGNIAFGGTGKTPLMIYLCDDLLKRQQKPALVCRSYKAKLDHSELVPLDGKAQLFGDEAVLLKQRFPQIPVISGPQKWQSARLIEQKDLGNVVLLDDGFQHHALKKDWNALVFDLSKPWREQQTRESFSAIQRADVFFLTRVVDVNFEEFTQKVRNLGISKPTFFVQAQNLTTLDFTGKKVQLGVGTYGVVAGLGRPSQFLASLQNFFPDLSFELQPFPDHYAYTQKDVDFIENRARVQNWRGICCTQKDTVKIQNLSRKLPWYTVDLEIRVEPQAGWQDYWDHICRRLQL